MGRLNPRMIRIAGIALAIVVAPALVSMLPKILILGVLPAIIGAALAAVSIHAIVRHLSVAQVLLGTLPIALSAVSLWSMKRIFLDGAWPTYLPYYAIAAAVPFVLVQSYLARAKGVAG
jgi:hypothetical protein